MMPTEYYKMILQARYEVSVIAKNDKTFSEDFIEAYAREKAYKIAAQFHRDAEDVYEELVNKPNRPTPKPKCS